MKPVRVLDPAHVLAVCTYAIHADGDPQPPKIALTATDDAVTIRIAAETTRIATILRALHQAGYDATANGDLITVRGWSPARRSRRIALLDTAVQSLTEQLPFTPRTSIAMYQRASEHHGMAGRNARNHARHQVVRNLRDLVQLQTGPFTRQDPPGHANDPHTEMLLRQCGWLEDEVDLLLSRHRAIATQAIAEHRLETEHRAEAERIAADRTQPTATAQPPAVAAHDEPATVGATDDPPPPSPSSTQSDRDVRPVTPPARRGA